MEYTIGSVADFISANNTSNKAKVIKRKINQADISVKEESVCLDGTKGVKNKNQLAGNIRNKDRYFSESSFKRANLKSEVPKKRQQQSRAAFSSLEENESELTVIDHDMLQNEEEDADNKNYEDLNLSDSDSDDDDDDDDDEEDDDEEDDSIMEKSNKDLNSRTVFVGNVPVTITKKKLQRFFFKFGKVQSVRLRCIAPAQPGISKKVAAIKKLIHPKRLTMHSYVTFENREDARKALEANGVKFKDHHLRVQICDDTQKPDSSKAVFLGNLPFDIEDEELWKAFNSCGPIDSVRIIRDKATNMGIGVGYINFKSSDSVELALQMGPVTIKNKEIRINRYIKKKKKNKLGPKKRGQVPHKDKEHRTRTYKRPKGYANKIADAKLPEKSKPDIKEKTSSPGHSVNVPVKTSVFQGTKSSQQKKKFKMNKGFAKKMKLKQKIAPR